MKKAKILSLIIGLVFIFSAFVGCADFPRVGGLQMRQETNFVVRGQGSAAVQYGDLIYFINGYNDLGNEIPRHNRNSFGRVERGALYRARLNGERMSFQRNANEVYELVPNAFGREFVARTFDDNNPGLGHQRRVYENLMFHSRNVLRHEIDVEDEDIDHYDIENRRDLVDVERVVPKQIGTTAGNIGQAGGVWIFGNWIYYATPHARRNQAGRMQYERVDFMRTRVDGRETQLIYTTGSDASRAPYAFYRIGNHVYLVVFYQHNGNGRIVSVRMRDGARGPSNPRVIAENVTNVIFPVQDFYDSVNHYRYQNNLDHFIFFERNFNSDDQVISGNVVEMVRPNGRNAIEIYSTGHNTRLIAVNDGLLVYSHPNNLGDNTLRYTNLHNVLMGAPIAGGGFEGGNAEYRNWQLSIEDVSRRNVQVSGTFVGIYTEDFENGFVVFRSHHHSPPHIVGIHNGSLQMRSSLSHGSLINIMASAQDVNIAHVRGNVVYFINNSTNHFYRIAMLANSTPERISHSPLTDNHFAPALVAGFVMYFAFVDEFVVYRGGGGYAFFVYLARPGAEAVLVYHRASGDRRPDAEDDNIIDDDWNDDY